MSDTVNLETMNTWGQVFVSSFQQAFSQIIALAPRVLAMAVVLVAGYIAARLVASLVAALSDRIGLPTAAERGGLVESMKRVGITRSVSSILGQIVFWFLMCVFLMAAFNILELKALSDAMQGVVAYIPRLLVATVVVVIGLLIANFLRGVIATSADRLLLRPGPDDLHRRFRTTGDQVRAPGTDDFDHLRLVGCRGGPCGRPGRP
jgi:hypothetical protein